MDFLKDPDAVLDYRWDWAPLTNGRSGAKSDWLQAGETIDAATVTAETGLTVENSTINAGTAVTAWLSGGVAGNTYTVRCRITTNANRIDDRSVEIMVVER